MLKTKESDTYVGLTEEEANKQAKKTKMSVRVAYRDGERFMLTMDYRTDRVNLEIEKGIVVRATIG